jgi:hypothetical protein
MAAMNPMQFWVQLAEQWQKAWADAMGFGVKASKPQTAPPLISLPQRPPDLTSGVRLRQPILNCVIRRAGGARHRHGVIDEEALGVSREKHHRHLINDSGIRGAIFYAEDDCVGYAYISPDGHIGPLGVAQPKVLGAAFKTALYLAAKSGSSHVSAFLPGTSDVALSIAVDHGMRITFPMVLVSTHDFGNWAQYLPRNPGFM